MLALTALTPAPRGPACGSAASERLAPRLGLLVWPVTVGLEKRVGSVGFLVALQASGPGCVVSEGPGFSPGEIKHK